MRILWIDPGHTVGWATASITDEPDGRHFEALAYDNTKLKTFALALLQKAQDYDVIGYESYYIRPDLLRAHAGSDVPTLQLIGMIRLAAWSAQTKRTVGPEIVTQPPTRQSKGAGAMQLYFSQDLQDVVTSAANGPHDEGHYASALLHLAAWYHDKYGKATP